VIQVPVDAKVECTDGHAGRSSHTIIDPINKTITHVVVTTEESFASRQWLVPINRVAESTSALIRLDCTLEELSTMDEFSEQHYVKSEDPEPGEMAYPTYAYMTPYATPLRTDYIPVEIERIPPGELAIRRGAIMEATDGYVGKVGEFLIDPDNGHITHLILQEGHLWGKKEVLVPLSAVDHSLEDTVFLKLDKESVAGLPAIAVTRSYRRTKDAGGFELVARVYDDPESATKALEIVRNQKGVAVENAAVLVKDKDGKTSIKETGDASAGKGRVLGAVAGGLIGLIGGPVGVVIGALAGAGAGGYAAKHIDMGFPDEFLKNLQESLTPDSSAILVLVESSAAGQLSESLDELGGEEFTHSLSDQIVEQILAEEEESRE
jgi:uncharacterized membrane protein/sporulation protein YlmC with PRC-barrel domain